MNTKERFPISSHEVTNSRGESFDYKKYGIEPIVKSNSLDGDNFSTPHEWTPAGRAEKVNDARDAVAMLSAISRPLWRAESRILAGSCWSARLTKLLLTAARHRRTNVHLHGESL